MCGFFAIRRSRLLELAPQTAGFKIVFEMMIRAGGTLRVHEIPITFRERMHGKSKMTFHVALCFFYSLMLAVLQHLLRLMRERDQDQSTTIANVSIAPKQR